MKELDPVVCKGHIFLKRDMSTDDYSFILYYLRNYHGFTRTYFFDLWVDFVTAQEHWPSRMPK